MSDKIGAGRPTLYDEEFHIKLLHDTFINGDAQAYFCAQAGICGKTFNNWVNKNKNFKQAYDKCLEIGEAGSLRKAKDPGMNFNFNSWKFIHLNQFVFPKRKRAFKSKDKTIDGKFRSLWRALSNGYITPQEYGQLIGAIIAESKSKQPEDQKNTHDLTGLSDWTIKVINAVIQGKKVTIEE